MINVEESVLDYSAINQSRLMIYDLLSSLFGGPIEYGTLCQIGKNNSLKSLSTISEGANLILRMVEESKERGEEAINKELKEEYNRLFIGPNSLPAPLWESVYLDKEHIMFGEKTLEVRAAYEEFGLRFVRLNKEPEDHIAIELEFLSYLIENFSTFNPSCNKEQLIKYLDAQIRFMNDHLMKWAPQFCELMIKATECKLYKGAALLLAEFLPCDLEIATNLKEVLTNE